MLIIETLFKTYGFQFATVIGIISFFANRYFNKKDKKDELRHSLFQNLKVESMNNFIECYTASELCWIQLPYFDILSHKIKGKEVDEYVIPTHNKFTASYYKLFIILDSKEMLEFTEIYSSISEVNRLLGILMFDYDEKKLVVKTNRYHDVITKAQKENRIRLERIGEKFKLKYG